MKYELIVFDWDGTLVDSTGRIVDSMQRAAGEVGLASISDFAVQNIIGLGLPEALETLWPGIDGEQRQRMTEVYARFFVADSEVSMAFFAGADALLQNLTASGRQLAVATGKSRRGLDRMLDEHGVRHWFAATRCADETESKPAPRMLNELLQQLSVPAERALMIGDTSYDLDMAANAGVDAIAMTHGAHDESILRRHGPVAICHNLTELQHWIKNYG
ncbi:haloacid dehalogenase [Bacterioplanes sanyensis]|uniref:HAD family hydrolase n=1 Tax=Bacterioplanes sanyensis TaxID=1249553 RepID=UPI001679CD21|nr:HAD-IA family hydrolase [Bacterioplanes sanyensis]GGY42145.1 haloacid dehalogenase [Bacterioplanes sanyensis]